MERKRFIYLAGILPVAVCSVFQFFMLMTGMSMFVWSGMILAVLGILLSSFGVFHAYLFYSRKNASNVDSKTRRKHFLGHTVALCLGLVFSYQSFQTFKQTSASLGRNGLTVTIRNTSDKPAKDLRIQAGMFSRHFKEIPARGEQTFKLELIQETTLTAELGSGASVPKAAVQVAPSDRTVLVRLDYLQNILPEVK